MMSETNRDSTTNSQPSIHRGSGNRVVDGNRFGEGTTIVQGDVNNYGVDNTLDEYEKLLKKLPTTNPEYDKARIERQKGGLLYDSYQWILSARDYVQWRDLNETKLLWIKGDPGKGKTMLLCGIIDELSKGAELGTNIVYFFCQATDNRLDNAQAVVRGLLFGLLSSQHSLKAKVLDKYLKGGDPLDQDINSWDALVSILRSVLHDPSLEKTYLVIDGLDECTHQRELLIECIANLSPSPAKFLISSRNWPEIEDCLSKASSKVPLSLELNAKSVSEAVDVYIDHEVEQLAKAKKYDMNTRDKVQRHLKDNANDTFLWVALVCQGLSLPSVRKWQTATLLARFPPGLDSLYQRMVEHIFKSDDSEICRQVLTLICLVYRPLHIDEMRLLLDNPDLFPEDQESLHEVIQLCGSFLCVREDRIYFVHQSAKEFLLRPGCAHVDTLFPNGLKAQHQTIGQRSLELMTTHLPKLYQDSDGDQNAACRGTANTANTARVAETMKMVVSHEARDETDSSAPIQFDSYDDIVDEFWLINYAIWYWVDHLTEEPDETTRVYLADGGIVHKFFQKRLLNWLEDLIMTNRLWSAPQAVSRLSDCLGDMSPQTELGELLYDVSKFLHRHLVLMRDDPSTIYKSCLYFTPTSSIIRQLYSARYAAELDCVAMRPPVEETCGASPITMNSDGKRILAVGFTSDSLQIVSVDVMGVTRVFDRLSGQQVHVIRNPSPSPAYYRAAALSLTVRGQYMACVRSCGTLCSQDLITHQWKIHDLDCLGPLVSCVAIGHSDKGVRIAVLLRNGICHILSLYAMGEVYVSLRDNQRTECLSFSPDATSLAIGGGNGINIWDARTAQHAQQLFQKETPGPIHTTNLNGIVYSTDGTLVAAAFRTGTVRVWDTTSGYLLLISAGHGAAVKCIAMSEDGKLLLSGCYGSCYSFPDAATVECVRSNHDLELWFLAEDGILSPDGKYLATIATIRGSDLVQVRDAASQRHSDQSQIHAGEITCSGLSPDGGIVAYASEDGTISLWDTKRAECISLIKAFTKQPHVFDSIRVSPGGKWLFVLTTNWELSIWDVQTSLCLKSSLLEPEMNSGFTMEEMAISCNGRKVAIPCSNGIVKVLDPLNELHRVVDLNPSPPHETHPEPFEYKVTFTSDDCILGMHITADISLYLWDSDTGSCLWKSKFWPEGKFYDVNVRLPVLDFFIPITGDLIRGGPETRRLGILDIRNGRTVVKLNLRGIDGRNPSDFNYQVHTSWGCVWFNFDFDTWTGEGAAAEQVGYIKGIGFDDFRTPQLLLDGRSCLRLPPEYEPSTRGVVVHHSMLAIGTKAGLVTFFTLNEGGNTPSRIS